MTFPFQPIETRNVLRTIAEGQVGWPVAALQINLYASGYGLAVDGYFGPQTRLVVEQVQHDANLVADGKAGPATSQSIALRLMWPLQHKYRTPPGLGRGILEGESSYDLACVSERYGDGTRDIGAWQDNQPVRSDGYLSDEVLLRSFNAMLMADDTLWKIRREHDAYATTGCNDIVAWKLATLYHNRPVDAGALAHASVGMADINWLAIPDVPGWFTIGGVSYSNRQWDQKYVAEKTKYVTWD